MLLLQPQPQSAYQFCLWFHFALANFGALIKAKRHRDSPTIVGPSLRLLLLLLPPLHTLALFVSQFESSLNTSRARRALCFPSDTKPAHLYIAHTPRAPAFPTPSSRLALCACLIWTALALHYSGTCKSLRKAT